MSDNYEKAEKVVEVGAIVVSGVTLVLKVAGFLTK